MSEFVTSEDAIELLQAAIMNGIINVNDVHKQLKMEKEKRILEEHPFKKWKGTNGAWFTYIRDESKPSKRRLLHRKTEEDLNRAIIAAKDEEEEKKRIHNISGLYPYWLKSKSYHTNSSNYMKRIDCDWRKYYENDPISKKSFREMTKIYLDDWCHQKIKEYGMTKTCFYNMSMILRQMLEFAVDNGTSQQIL